MDYHRLAAAGALAEGDFVGLRLHVDSLAALEPQNSVTRFTQSALRLNSPDPQEIAQARATLAGFARGDELRIRATLALIDDAPRRWPSEKLPGRIYARLAEELNLGDSGSAPNYLRLEVSNLTPRDLTALIVHMQAQPTLAANDAVMLGQWLLLLGRGREALFWLDTLDEPLRAALAVRQSTALCAARLELWPRLEQLVSGGIWGPVPTGAVQQAFYARTLRAENNDSKASSQWNAAIRSCEQSLTGLQALLRLAEIWGWPDQQEQVRWVLVRQYPAEESAWRSLVQQALAEGNSAESWRIYQAWAQVAPSNPAVQAERVLVGLLTRPGEAGLGTRAEELFLQHPGSPACRVARALALWRNGQAVAALVMLDAAELNYARDPRFALVRGLVYAKLGRPVEAEQMFALSDRARLLPEERALVASARASAR